LPQNTKSCVESTWDIQTMEIDHFKFIGECFVDEMIYGWKIPELDE
jgi:hypothetical protein